MGTICGKEQNSLELKEEDSYDGYVIRKSKELPITNQCAGIYRQKYDYHHKPHGQAHINHTTATKSTLHQFPELAARYKQVVCGDFDTNLSAKAKIVRIFISSTFTDTAAERNALMVKVFPQLKTFCQEKGYEFQVVDMRWGVREQSADDHTTLDLCLKEIKACQQISTGPNFVTFLGQKYGFRPFPPKIPKPEFEQLFSSIEEISDQALLERWFQCDDNAVPATYLLQPISLLLPGYLSSDVNKRNKAFTEWQHVFKRLQTVLRRAAVKSLKDKEQIHKYFMSVTESEIRSGILSSSNPSTQCFWFSRTIENLNDHVTDEHAQFYIDIQKECVIDKEAQELLENLKKDTVLHHLSDSNVKRYQVEWRGQGIDPEHCENHQSYIEQMRHDFRSVLEELIESAILIRMSHELSDSVYDEASQHLLFCKSKCETFYGREDVLNQCKNFLSGISYPKRNDCRIPQLNENQDSNVKFENVNVDLTNTGQSNGSVDESFKVNDPEIRDTGIPDSEITKEKVNGSFTGKRGLKSTNFQDLGNREQEAELHKKLTKNLSSSSNEHKSNRPLVIYGQSGCGKTSVVSMVAMKSRDWLGKNLRVIIRYIGTTPDSSLVRLLLRSVCRQICVVFDEDSSFIGNDIKTLKQDFLKCLEMATAKEPLLIVLDSLDQFGPEDSARQLSWLPMALPDHVSLVVSTIPGEEYECFPVLEAFLPKECFVEVPKLPQDDAANILVNWLKMEHRTLSTDQQNIIKEALQSCSLPIFVRVTFDEAIRWKSYSPPEQTKLEHTVRGAINALFSRLENQHGHVLVRHALGYVTAAKSGLTETELEDVLSCDDEVLDDVYQFWTPPVRRIPPLLWVRVRADLAGYLVDRGADEARVITWYHRQFIEAARARYLNNKEDVLKIHKSLSEYFLGRWSNGASKPYITSDGTKTSADRLVARQPLTFQSSLSKTTFNYRKLNELPYHLTCAQMQETLKREVLCSFEFLLVNLMSSSLRDVLDDYDFALQSWPKDDDIRLVKETLQLSTYALAEYPKQLPCQLLGRIKNTGSKFLQDLLQQARTSPHSNLIPSAVCLTSPGGPMVHSLSGQSQPSTALTVSDDGKLVASASADKSCSIWEVSSGRLVRTLESFGEHIKSLLISADNSVVVASSKGCVSAWQISTGQRLFSIEGHDTLAPVCFIDNNSVSLLATIIGNAIKLYSLKTRKQLQEFVDAKLKNCSPQERDYSALFNFKSSLYYMVENGFNVPGSSVRVLDVSTGVMKDLLKFNRVKEASLVGVSAYGTLLVLQSEPMEAGGSRVSVKQKSIGVIELWDAKMNKLLRNLNNRDDNMSCYTMSSDKTNVVTLNDAHFLNSENVFQGLIKIFNLQTDDVKECTLKFPSSIHLIRYVDVNHFFSSSRDKLVRVWDLTRNQVSQETQDEELEIVGSFGDKIIFEQEGKVGVVDIRSGMKAVFMNGCAPQLVFLNETQVVITNEEKIFLYDLTLRKLCLKFHGETRTECKRILFVSHQSEVVAISKDGKALNIYDVKSGEEIGQLKSDEEHSIASFKSSSDGRFCVIAQRETSKGKLCYGYTVWDVQKRTQVKYLKGLQHALPEFADLDISHDGTYMLDTIFDTISSQYNAIVYDVTSGSLVNQPDESVHSAAFLSSGKQFLLGTIDGQLRMYDCVSGQHIHGVRAHSGAIHQIFTNDHTDVVMTTAGGLDSKDRSLRLWRITDNEVVIHAVFTPDAKISSMAFAEEGKSIVLEITDVVPFWLTSDGDSKCIDLKNDFQTHSLNDSFTADLTDWHNLESV